MRDTTEIAELADSAGHALPLLTPSEVSGLVRIPVKTLAQWRSLRKGPRYLKLGGHVRYRHADVEAWLEDQASAA